LHFHPLQFLPDRFNFLVGLGGLEGPFRLLDLGGCGGGIPGELGGLEEPFRLLDLGVILNLGLDIGPGGISDGPGGISGGSGGISGGPGGISGGPGGLSGPGGPGGLPGGTLFLDLPSGFVPNAPNGGKLALDLPGVEFVLDLLFVLVILEGFGKPKSNPRDISCGLLLGSSLLVEIILDDSLLGGTKTDDGGSPDNRLGRDMGGDTFRDGYCLGTGSGIGSGNFDFNSSEPFSSFSTAVAAASWISR